DKLNSSLKGEKAKIIGEVSGFQEYPGRTYLYFSIKDSKDQSTVKCFMWKRDFHISGVALTDGMEVIITAYPNIYKPNGGLTMQVELLERVGEGALQIAYEKLKKELENEGLFSESRKRPLPDFPHKIGVITSKSGAVINDFLTNIGKFGYEILFVDSRVEGQEAIKELLSAVETLKHKDIDVLVIMRGGGSLESFQAFNNEVLVRAVAKFPVPVLTGIGHDKDAPLVSLVSDKNVSTPTAVANLLNSSWNSALANVNMAEQKINFGFESVLKDSRFIIDNSEVLIQKRFNALFDIFKKAEQTLAGAVGRIGSGIDRIKDNIKQAEKDLVRDFSLMVGGVEILVSQSEKLILQSSPENQLKRGYSIVRRGGKVLRSIKEVKKGDQLDISVSDGIIKSITQ
ncbi:MAG: Exodeoxyribonuclease 7 large subunit, partial [Patescibacteria group bacterium]|nr:Exodeoxyribonuclease 7 large subunit [Patescibacteria group bacterium]